MKNLIKQPWVLALAAVFVVAVAWIALVASPGSEHPSTEITYAPQVREHLDHSPFFAKAFDTPQDVTRACLDCHGEASDQIMKGAHWSWLGNGAQIPGHDGYHRIGKRNLINNFCIGVQGNWASCTRCHIGYGWKDDSFDFKDPTNVDCLVCHDWSGSYLKGNAGMPREGVDLLAVAKGVGYPKRDNCGVCHSYGGGGLGVKHGDLDNTLDHPSERDDVHMGRGDMMCIDCHATTDHDIIGKSMSVGVDQRDGVGCARCHEDAPHNDPRIDAHLDSVACETCHIPAYARRVPTKVSWDWSKAGDDSRKDDVHEYLKIKGEFVYDTDIEPTYLWYNGTSSRYLLGDPINPDGATRINYPAGSLDDPRARIHPFKVHVARQPYDVERGVLLQPVTSGEGGYWHEFDWDKALKLGAEFTDMEYSGKYDFTETEMFWPLSHTVVPGSQALTCDDCHGASTRMDWKALGYDGDPIENGGRHPGKRGDR